MFLSSERKWSLVIGLVFFQSLFATLGSLFFSEIMQFPPCVLCWYQRIFMYPLVIIFGVALLTNDKKVVNYALPLSLVGLIIAFYHNLLYYGLIPESIQPCLAGVSCTTQFFAWFGFITIPLLSLVAFSIIVGALVYLLHFGDKEIE